MQKNLLILPNEPFPLRLYFVQKSAILFIRGGTRLLAGIRPGIKKCARPRLFCAEASADDKERENMDINKYTPKYKVSRSHLLRLSDTTAEDIFEFLYLAKALKKKFSVGEHPPLLKNKTIALLFGKASTRTRVSFEMGIRQLGGDYLFLPKNETQLSRGESIKDTAIMLGRYGISALVLRAFNDAELNEFAEWSNIPVINGISDEAHPLQILSDLFTIWEVKGRFDNLKIAYIGDGNNVANSLIMGCSKVNMDIAIASPHGYSPARDVVERGMQYGNVLITDDVAEAVRGADIVYTDVFISMNDEDDEKKKRMLARYRVTKETMALAKEDAVFMHCMPAHRGEEVSAEVIDGPQSIVYDQAENRLHINKAALALLTK